MNTIAINPELIYWAIERSGIDVNTIAKDFPKLHKWGIAGVYPTIKQLERFANKTRTPFGYLFLNAPPDETLPIPAYRTFRNKNAERLSPELIDTVQMMQMRRDWMRDFMIEEGEGRLDFVGSFNLNSEIMEVVKSLRRLLNLDEEWAAEYSSWKEALNGLYEAIENAGILIMKNGVVGNNTHRKLNPEEFRGFVLIDEYAPLIFVNGADFETAQIFTMAHELAHLLIGQGAIFNLEYLQPYNNGVEEFCDSIAAEFLAPKDKFLTLWNSYSNSANNFKLIGEKFKVSQIVIARRALDFNLIDKGKFFEFYDKYINDQEEVKSKKKEKRRGNFYSTQNTRIGKRFASSVIVAAKEGRISYKYAFKLTGLRGKTFDEYSNRLGIK